MTHNMHFPYGETEYVQVLGLPYLKDFDMFLLLPKERFGLPEFLRDLTGAELRELITGPQKNQVEVCVQPCQLLISCIKRKPTRDKTL